MSEHLYVATDFDGVQHLADHDRRWSLPSPGPTGPVPGAKAVVAANEHDLVAFSASGLLKSLGERIFTVEFDQPVAMPGQVWSANTGKLVTETKWDATLAALFALGCVDHVIGDAADVKLPHGQSLGDVLTDAKHFVESDSGIDEERLGFVSRLAHARRLNQSKSEVGRLAMAATEDDIAKGLDALDDPAWATAAAVGDAVLAAVEALHLLALPRYASQQERTYQDRDNSDALKVPRVISTPFGPFTIGGERNAGTCPTYVNACDAAERSRLVVRNRDGEYGQTAELEWQAQYLESYLLGD